MRARLVVLLAICRALVGCEGDPALTPKSEQAVPAIKALESAGDPLTWVQPLIGSQGSGNVFVGASLPHGAIKLGPDTANGGGTLDGYDYDAQAIEGFSHTHLDGPGGSGYGYSQVLLLPQAGTLVVGDKDSPVTWDRATEVVSPAYYAATLGPAKIRAELTAGAHCGRHRYTFQPGGAGERPRVLVDLGHTRGGSLGGHVRVDSTGVRGRGDYTVHPLLSTLLAKTTPATGLASVHTTTRFSKPIEAFGAVLGGQVAATSAPGAVLELDGAHLKAYVEFAPSAGTATVVEACTCLSWLSQEQADAYANSPECDKNFDQVRGETAAAWRGVLDRVRVEKGTDSDRIRLYTGLYHALLQPADYTEDGKFWNGMANPPKVQAAQGRRYFTDDWCAWDTARTTHPLLTLLEPEVVADMAQSMVWQGLETGYLPKCTWQATGDSRVMTANFPYAILADAIVKDLKGFDTKAALDLMKHGALTDQMPLQGGGCGYFDQGTPPSYVESGWVSVECDTGQAASMTLEYAYHDWCLAQAAAALGDSATAKTFAARSGNWRNVWNPEHKFPQSRRLDGTWVEPFDPTSMAGFTEANAWIYQWFVPHDGCGLAQAIGGRQATLDRLDAFFAGHFDMGNEPDFHAPWLYQDVGRPDRTADVVADLLAKHFSVQPQGLPGNDDAGATSAWLALATLGLFPVAPGDGWWRISTPVFDKASLEVGGHVVQIVAQRHAPADRYITAATWNGKTLTEARIAHAELAKGGVLALQLANKPGSWGTAGWCPGLAP